MEFSLDIGLSILVLDKQFSCHDEIFRSVRVYARSPLKKVAGCLAGIDHDDGLMELTEVNKALNEISVDALIMFGRDMIPYSPNHSVYRIHPRSLGA